MAVPDVSSLADRAQVERQLGRPPRALARVVARCAEGLPVAIEQHPVDEEGHPFPTTFWLTCPRLVRAIGLLEDAGGVRELEQRLADEPELAASFAAARARQIARRPALGDLGVGGTREPFRVKCLHAHAAYALGDGPYRVGEEILLAAGGVPSGPCCRDAEA